MASSHPSKGTVAPGHRTRRSWFDAPPLTTLDSIPVQKPENVSKRQSLDVVETLTLTHFTNPPRITFGKTSIGKTKLRTLLLRNPHDFEQKVIIEKFPYKKKFMVNQTRFSVSPEEVFSLQITWTPEEAGGYREMIQFHINDVYRLQAFVIGTVEKPKLPHKIRKFPLAPRVRQPPTVVQTPALSSIRNHYSPNHRQEVLELMEDMVSSHHYHNENKENSGDKSHQDKCGAVKSENVGVWKWSDKRPVVSLVHVKSHMKTNQEKEIVKTPTPLESTTIMNKLETDQVHFKNKRKWRDVSDITSPTLIMSPIPVIEDGEHGLTVDSYFQVNETSTAARTKHVEPTEVDESLDLQKICSASSDRCLKETFVVPLPPADCSRIKKKPEATEDSTTLSSEDRMLVTSLKQLHQQTQEADETRIIPQDRTVPVKLSAVVNTQKLSEQPPSESVSNCSDNLVALNMNSAKVEQNLVWSPPKIAKDNTLTRTSEISPRTMLDESLTLISQMKMLERNTHLSPNDNNTSINSSLISQGQGIVSPNSFMEDMRSMMWKNGDGDDKCKNTSTPKVASPSVIFNSSIPHSILVSHLQGVRRSLHDSPLTSNSEYGTPKKQRGTRFVPQRRSITSQFQKEEMRKIATAARAIIKDKDLLMGDYCKHSIKKSCTSMKETHKKSQVVPNPCQGIFKRDVEIMKAIKRSPLGRSLTRRSPPKKISHSSSAQDFAMKRVKSKINKSRKRSSPMKPLPKSADLNKSQSRISDHIRSSKNSPNDSDAMFNFITPQKENCLLGSCSAVACRSIDSATVVKCKSHENTAENSGRFFHDLLPSEDEQREKLSTQNSSLSRGKLFPDICVKEGREKDEIRYTANGTNNKIVASKMYCDGTENIKLEEQTMICITDFIHQHSHDTDTCENDIVENKTDLVQVCPGRWQLGKAVSVAESLMSQQIFCPMSPSNIPTSPMASLDHSRRGTITVTKSRTSDALLTAMNSRKRMFQDSPHKPSSFSIKPDDKEIQENIQVNVEEHYEEIDGSMYLIVKETTNIIKSTTETYTEQLAISPQEFQTPTRLPNSPDLTMSRRSTHVVRSPKVINIASFNKRQIDFIEEVENSITESDQLQDLVIDNTTTPNKEENDLSSSVTHETFDMKSCVTKSETFEKEQTFLADPQRHYLLLDKSEPPITSVCAFSPSLVDYENDSESDRAGDVTKDSLDTSQSVDSLAGSVTKNIMHIEDNNIVDLDEKQIDTENACASYLEKCAALLKKDLFLKKESAKNYASKVFYKKDMNSHKLKNSDKSSSKCPGIAGSDESEDEQFYDTMSERYYDALSDAGIPELEMRVELEQVAESDRYPRSHVNDSGRHCAEIDDSQTGVYMDIQSEVQRMQNIYAQNVHYPAVKLTDSSTETMMSLSLKKQTLAIEMDIDHKEMFEVTDREVLHLCSFSDLKPLDEIIRSTPEAKIKRKLRRSVSVDILVQNQLSLEPDAQKHNKTVNFNICHSHVPKNISSKKLMTPSKSVILIKNAAQFSTRHSPTKISKDQLPSGQRTGGAIKQRSQSMLNLSRQTERSSLKTEHRAVDSRANQVKQTASKQKSVVKGVAQSRLVLIKKVNKGIPRHPMLFAAKNMYYDERWMEKQERGFVQWLNFVLTPPDEYVAVTSRARIDAGSLSLDIGHVAPRLAPTKEILSFRAYAARRRLNLLRRGACELYQSEFFVSIIRKIEVEVESRRISVRIDKMLHADVGIKQKLLDLLLHYSPLWLRIGLEAIFGEVLMLQSNQDVMGLSRFILTRLLTSPDIAAEFSHPTVPHLYKKGYMAAVSRHTVKKFLLLVYFLDQAKLSRLIDHDPCLFCKDAGIKSSKEILIEFSKEVLSGEGDITRHLAYLGYTVCQTQKPIDEFDYAVTSLSSDLRDGLRLCRILELLTGDLNVMSKLRMPAISRLQKIHNTEVFFKSMHGLGLDFSSLPGTAVSARDIVDGHREKTLSLLWQLIIHFQSSIQVNEVHLKEEIDILMKSLQLKVAMQKIGAISMKDCEARRDSGETKLLMENKRLQLIFQWSRLVCLHYGVKLENFTVSFSDGRALCCLLHHYHPALLPVAEIHFQTTISFQESAEDKCQIETDPDASMDWGNRGGGLMPDENNPEMIEQLLTNEKSNYKTLYEKVSALGGVPLMLRFADMSNTIPDEKLVSTYVSYLCARLLDIREEVRAARLIQMAWKRKQLRRAIQNRQRRTKAAIAIQHWIRPYLTRQVEARQVYAATCIQTAWRGYSACLYVGRLKLNIQEAVWRERQEQSAVTLQCLWHSRSASHELARLKEKQQWENIKMKELGAAVTIQKYIRGLRVRNEYVTKRSSAIMIQASWRRHLAKKTLNTLKQKHLEHSAVVIQKWMKRNYCMSQYTTLRKAVVSVQKYWRMRQAMHKLHLLRDEQHSQVVTTIQKYVRAWFAKKRFQQLRESAIVVQNCWRRKQAKKELSVLKSERENKASVLVQSVIKSIICRQKYLKMRKAVMIIQRNWKRTLALRVLTALKIERYNKAAAVIQKYIKGHRAQSEFIALRKSTIFLQTTWRMLQAKKQLKYLKQKKQEHSATVIQRFYRQFRCRQDIQNCKSAAISIQKTWRMHNVKKIFSRLKREQQALAAVTIQRFYRGFIQRTNYAVLKSAVVVLQKNWRMIMAERLSAELRNKQQESAALVLQKYLRRWKHRSQFLRLKSAAIVLQNAWKLVEARRFFLAVRFRRQEESAILIQKLWKGYKVRHMLITKRRAASKIQSFWRMACAKKRYTCMIEAVVTIQRFYRGFIQRKNYTVLKSAVVVLQKNWRMIMAGRLSAELRNKQQESAALVLQKYLRRWKHRSQFLRLKSAALVLQNAWKLVKAHRSILAMRFRKEESAILIQKLWKGYKAHQMLVNRRRAASKIQSYWRMACARKHYICMREAASLIQAWHRANLESKRQQSYFITQRRSVICIQSWWKCTVTRGRFHAMKLSAVIIQTNLRCFQCRHTFLSIKLATVIIQRGYRHYLEGLKMRKKFLTLRHATIIIQRSFRRYLQKSHEKRESAAFVLQTAFRKVNARRKFVAQKLAAQRIQKHFREYQKMKTLRESFLHQRQAALVIQMAYRTLVRKRQQNQICQSVTKIQTFVRSRIVRNQFQNMKKAVVIIQRKLRANKLSLAYREAFLQLRTSAIIIQRFYRAVKVQRIVHKEIADQHSAATKIQAQYRGWSQKQDYLLLRAAAVCLQRRYRSHLAGQAVRNKVIKMREAVSMIQRRWRSYKEVQKAKRIVQQLTVNLKAELQRKLEEEKLENERKEQMASAEIKRKREEIRKEAAAVVLQRSLRAYVIKKDSARRNQAALVIQRNVRGHQSRIRYHRELKHIYHLQHIIRGFVFCRKFQRMKLAARIIQRKWREIREGRRCRVEYIAKLEAVVKVQAQLKMIRQLKIHQDNMKMVIAVQTCIRTFIQRHFFAKIRKQIVGLQRRVRNNQQMKKDRDRFLKLRHSAIKIQTVVRLWLAYRHVQQEKSFVKIQAHFRMHQQRFVFCQAYEAVQAQKSFMEMNWQQLDTNSRNAAVLAIQNSFQKYLSCKVETKHLAASIIQNAVQRYLNKRSQKQNNAALIIQRALRNYVFRRRMLKTQCAVMIQTSIRQFLCRHNYLAKHRSVVVLQEAIRGWQARRRNQAAICLQAGIRGYLVRKKLSPLLKERLCALQEQMKQNRACILIQALWRGFVTRKNTKNRKLTQARKRLQEANRHATSEKTLGSRTSSALDYLLKEKDLAHILEALMHLEVSTRLSPKCCERMAEMNAVSALYQLISSCNRSVPHMELIKYSVNILLNLAKYERTTCAVIEPQESVSSIVELLQIYREKGAIFSNCCMLLAILGLHPGRKEEILRHPLIVDRLQSIHALTLRKQRAHQNRQVTQAKMAALRSFNCTLPLLTPSKSKYRGIQPDWALARDGIKDLEDPLAAVTYVMGVLQIRPKM